MVGGPPRRAPRLALLAVLLAAVAFLVLYPGGDPGPRLSPSAERGRAIFRSYCASCHDARNPFADRSDGPATARASRALLEAKVLRGAYPPGHRPRRASALMPRLPHLASEIEHLAAFLAEVPEPAR